MIIYSIHYLNFYVKRQKIFFKYLAHPGNGQVAAEGCASATGFRYLPIIRMSRFYIVDFIFYVVYWPGILFRRAPEVSVMYLRCIGTRGG